ncbi:MAG: isocitrate lyase [Thaumarchaeota archaeon]|nr:MAG: isocitrate lyase [Nitrososphaerota archaeon]
MKPSREEEIANIKRSWRSDRWNGVLRPYSAESVHALRGSVRVEHTIARLTARKLWNLLKTEPYVSALGALTGSQAVEMVQAGLKAIYLSGWQVAADANLAGQTYPDQSLYPSNSVPVLARRINQALQRADQIQHAEGRGETDWLAPIVADGEAGFGGPLNVVELTKSMIEAGVAAVHYEDQLSDLMGVPTILLARTDACTANLITSDVDARDRKFLTDERTQEGFFVIDGGLEMAIERGLAYAPYADMIWCETSSPDLEEARRFASAIHRVYPEKLLAYNCSSSFNWGSRLDEKGLSSFQTELAGMGYNFQFITLAGFHTMNYSIFELARAYRAEGMSAYARLQKGEFEKEREGYKAVKHQSFVGVPYFDEIQRVITGGESSTTAMKGSTERAQFGEKETRRVKKPEKGNRPKQFVVEETTRSAS